MRAALQALRSARRCAACDRVIDRGKGLDGDGRKVGRKHRPHRLASFVDRHLAHANHPIDPLACLALPSLPTLGKSRPRFEIKQIVRTAERLIGDRREAFWSNGCNREAEERRLE